MSKWEKFKPEEEPKEVRVPEQWATWTSPSLVIEKPNRWGFNLKTAIRRIAKRLPEYHLPIKPSYTIYNENKEISVNTLGRWAFGVPGFRGRLTFEGGEPSRIIIHYPEGSPPELIAMLEKAVKQID